MKNALNRNSLVGYASGDGRSLRLKTRYRSMS